MKPGKKPFTEKTCPRCGVLKPRSEYYKKGETVSHKCKPCSLASSSERASKYIGKYSEYQNEWRRKKYSNEAEYRERVAAQKKSSYDARIEAINQARRDRWANDPYDPARKYYRRKDVKDRTPKWVDLKQVLEFYAKCPEGYEVDHIVPLKGLIDGRPVTGLHALHNLQYLTKAENRKKYNRITEETLLLSEC
jgi:uncharacterized Zn finger protein (UPF0148 family)